MKRYMLVSTKAGNGMRKNDFCHVPEGEPLTFGSECDGEEVDGNCGCRRSMAGIKCGMATTTMKVKEISEAQHRKLEKEIKGRWMDPWGLTPKEASRQAKKDLKELDRICAKMGIGFVIEKRGPVFHSRNAVPMV